MNDAQMVEILQKVANEYPPDMRAEQLFDVPRIAFNISMAKKTRDAKPFNEIAICDIGGGAGLFSVGCAALGFKRVVLVDDFHDPINIGVGESALGLHKRYGVEIVPRDVIAQGLGDALEGAFDVFTTFASMEHWHHSPKRLFREVYSRLNSGGLFILSGPNCVNLKRRISVPLGFGKWSITHDWYEREVYRSHVREPDVDDLKYIARDMGLVDVKIYGRNWGAYSSRNSILRMAEKLLDHPLRLRPTLCAEIYMIGRKG